MSSKEKSPAATGGTPALVPKLRFPEFQEAGEWETAPGNELFQQVNNRQAPTGLPILAITQEHGAIPRHMIDYHVSVTEKSLETYKEVRPRDFIISLRSFQGGIEFSEYHGICSPAYVILRKRWRLSDLFYRQHFKSHAFIRQLTKNLEGLRDGKMISYKQFSELHLLKPTLPEQQKIADCLESLDALIAAQGRKVEMLSAYKKGLMQQLFPQEGETQPRLRFPELRDAGEWTEKCIDKLVTIQSGATPSKENPEFWSGSIPWVSAKDMKRLFLDDSEEHISEEAIAGGARLAPAGTLLMLTRGMTLLKDVPICFLRREMSFNQDVKGLRPKPGVNGLFFAWLLAGNKNRLLAMVNIAGHGTGKIDTDELKALTLPLPGLIEQQRIADCLTSLDDLITAEDQKLDTLKTHKKGLMQQLFPQIGENEA